MFGDPLTLAVSCLLWEATTHEVVGVMDTVTAGAREIIALPDFGGLFNVVAVTVTVCVPDKIAGAV